ncbi:XRE family transcriptional regulator [Billgrantia gudaonensis]|uniref:Helix-turn-helix domain-containing protein n=1 Tax=Billgrantia gudaonensis TaxID=376427 RepID=A0A1G9DTF9_9GAMM|nr:LexA family transcriptional regulator [Halomonas gudaonensis]SDK67110.1 Helix-turn-helix domain-containing protein [Halomonas gudaonensis]
MTLSNIGERLREERTRLGLSQTAFGEVGGVKKFAQSNYETGKRHPDALYLESLAKIGVDIQYVVSGIRSTNDAEGVEPAEEGLSPVAMYDIEAAAGDGRSLEQEEVETTLYFPTDQLAAQGLDPAQVVGIKVRGDSMDGTLADGDWVLVDRSRREPKPEGVFLLLVHGERRIKRVQRVAGGAWLLISDNEHYQPELIKPQDMKDVEILGRCEIRIGRVS